MSRIFPLFAAALVAPAAGIAQTSSVHPTPPPVIQAVEKRGDIRIDGVLNEAAWNAASPMTSFTQSDPFEGQPGSQRTEVRFLFDGDALYVGARMFDTAGPPGISARLTQRDRRRASDYLEIILDTYHDHLGRALFSLNPVGVREDALAQGDAGMDDSWDPVWEGSARIDSLGWTAEMRIPFSQLRFSRDSVQTWGIQVTRHINRNRESAHVAFWTKRETGGPSRYAHLEGIVVPGSGRHLELLPYVVSRGRFIEASAAGDPFNDGSRIDARVGGDAKLLLTSNLTLDATFNPDFGQVEVDPAVVNLSDFETFFPERRPFFVEGAGIFDFGGFSCHFCMDFRGIESFYSRRIGRSPQLNGVYEDSAAFRDMPERSTILGAAKVTGRTSNGYTIGLLDALTRREHVTLANASGDRWRAESEPLTNYAVGRVKKDLRGGNLVIGGIATSVIRDLSDSIAASRLSNHSEMLGGDFDLSWSQRTYRWSGRAALSNVSGSAPAMLRLQRSSARYFQRPDRDRSDNGLFTRSLDSSVTRMTGWAALTRVGKESGNWLWEIASNARSPGYEVNDIAFLRRADYVANQGTMIRTWTVPTRWYRDAGAGLSASTRHNFDGDLTEAWFVTGQVVTFANYWQVENFQQRVSPVFDDRATRGGPVVMRPGAWQFFGEISTDRSKPVSFEFNPFIALPDEGPRTTQLSLETTWRPAPNVELTFETEGGVSGETQQYVTSVADPTSTRFFGRRYVFADLVQRTIAASLRLDWTFRPSVTLAVFAQPFISAVDFREFKEFDAPRSLSKTIYSHTPGKVTVNRNPDGSVDEYVIDPDLGGPAAPFTISNPDFNFRSLRGNAVLRWEYRPGSTMFFVWTQLRSGESGYGNLDFSRDRAALFRERPANIFLVKVSYWFGM